MGSNGDLKNAVRDGAGVRAQPLDDIIDHCVAIVAEALAFAEAHGMSRQKVAQRRQAFAEQMAEIRRREEALVRQTKRRAQQCRHAAALLTAADLPLGKLSHGPHVEPGAEWAARDARRGERAPSGLRVIQGGSAARAAANAPPPKAPPTTPTTAASRPAAKPATAAARTPTTAAKTKGGGRWPDRATPSAKPATTAAAKPATPGRGRWPERAAPVRPGTGKASTRAAGKALAKARGRATGRTTPPRQTH